MILRSFPNLIHMSVTMWSREPAKPRRSLGPGHALHLPDLGRISVEAPIGRALSLFALVELLDEAIDEPTLVGHGQGVGLAVRETGVVHQQERRLQDQLLLVTGLKAKERRRRSALIPPRPGRRQDT